MVFRKIKSLLGGKNERETEPVGLGVEGIEKIGTEEDPLRLYEEGLERNFTAMEAEQRGEVNKAIGLYEQSVSEKFVDSHPYERLANLYEQRRNYGESLRVLEVYIRLARGGELPRGAQRSAERRLPGIEARVKRYREMF